MPITRKEVELIFHARKSVLYYHRGPWVTKECNFTLETNDRANVFELIGIYMLYLIGKKYNWKNIELYRDDGPAAFKNASGPASEKIRKTQLQYLFKQKDLQTIIKSNYFGVTFNLNDGSYRPYRKPTDATHYIHIQWDHPPSIINQLPWSIEKPLSKLLSSKDMKRNYTILWATFPQLWE